MAKEGERGPGVVRGEEGEEEGVLMEEEEEEEKEEEVEEEEEEEEGEERKGLIPAEGPIVKAKSVIPKSGII